MTVFAEFGVRTLINAKGTATRLSGGIMRREVADAMVAASSACVDMAELQAAASAEIARVTGAEAGYIASGASACLLLATAACMAGLDPGRMALLPDARGMKHQVIMVRSQRNFYDHAIRAAGATIIEVGLPDRYAGAGVRDAAIWEIEDAITAETAAIHWVADAASEPPLAEVARAARRHGVPVIVDAAAQLPPAANLKRFIAEGADLVAFSGGKALGGPQASGLLCGRRDLIMSAALQHLDLDIYEDMWTPPPGLIDRSALRGLPPHGIGRSCKAGKEEIIGLLTALRLFTSEADATRHARWLAILTAIAEAVGKVGAARLVIANAEDITRVPELVITCAGAPDGARRIIGALIAGDPSIHTDPALRAENRIVVNPLCIAPGDAALIGERLRRLLSAEA